MTSISDPKYQAAVAEFARYLQRLQRAAGDPSFREVGKVTGVSVASVHRYLNGKVLPSGSFVRQYIRHYGAEIAEDLGMDELYGVKKRWKAARDVLKPIEPENSGSRAA